MYYVLRAILFCRLDEMYRCSRCNAKEPYCLCCRVNHSKLSMSEIMSIACHRNMSLFPANAKIKSKKQTLSHNTWILLSTLAQRPFQDNNSSGLTVTSTTELFPVSLSFPQYFWTAGVLSHQARPFLLPPVVILTIGVKYTTHIIRSWSGAGERRSSS